MSNENHSTLAFSFYKKENPGEEKKYNCNTTLASRINSLEYIVVTAALPYANGPLHLGHIRSTYLPADIYARFLRLLRKRVRYVCASDEHGTPIVAAAEKEGKSPVAFTNHYHEKDKQEFAALGFSMDIFHRTSSNENIEMTRFFYSELKKNGHIYEKEIEQFFCEKCARYLPDRFIVGTCPKCNANGQYSDYCEACGSSMLAGEIQSPKCIVCKSVPETRKTSHEFFKLSKFSSQLKQWLETNQNLQSEVVNYVKDWITKGLDDWDITRDLDWGVKIPGRKGQVFYVWFDAPIEYVSATAAQTDEWDRYWLRKPDEYGNSYYNENAIVHFIGKDIIYHHFLFWPAMLMGMGRGFHPPDNIAVRGYLNLEGRKFSKSKGWLVSLEDFLKEFPADYLRYYETAVTPHTVSDADFTWPDFQAKINNELVANIGNYINRVLTLCSRNCSSLIPIAKNMDNEDIKMLEEIKITAKEVKARILNFQFKEALERNMAFCMALNRYLSSKQPWKEKDVVKNNNCIYVAMQGVAALSILMYPFLPFSMERLHKVIGVTELVSWNDLDKELIRSGVRITGFGILFEKIADEKIKELEGRLKR
ncbi:TPA: methionine--tRNA ligase [Candidatus Micrarchaeota archaeon]|nr:methionine--tRNA ligase [Candidatus Micrarchaeota archaeon]